MHDVAVIGGGIIGTSAATYLAEAGLSVVLVEQAAIGAGASGRNSGAIQHPYDAVMGELNRRSIPLYRELAAADPDFRLPAEPDGLLLVSTDEGAAAAVAAEFGAASPELQARFVPASEMSDLEPALASGVAGVLLATGYAVVPASATLAFASWAQRAGVEIQLGEAATPAIVDGRAVGVTLGDGQSVDAGSVLVCGGPWSVDIVPGWRELLPISRSWGVVVSVDLASPPRRILEELSIDANGSAQPVAFSLVTAAGASSLGSTFLADEPEPDAMVDALRRRGRAFVPAVAGARVLGVRACARPVSFDGRPLIGPVPGIYGLFVCAGHGPWGISTGPASARLAVEGIVTGRSQSVPAELAASRYEPVG